MTGYDKFDGKCMPTVRDMVTIVMISKEANRK